MSSCSNFQIFNLFTTTTCTGKDYKQPAKLTNESHTYGRPVMALADVSATVSYLTDAAHLLHATAPATSAHLMSQRHELLYRQGFLPSDVQRQGACGACGHILLAVGDDSLSVETRRERRQTKKGKGKLPQPQKPRKGSRKVIRCGLCHKSTRINLEPPVPAAKARISKSQSQSAASTPMNTGSNTEASKKPSASASSKKRAKNRKAGLQALLAGQQKGASSSLSLADFMKK
jgi:hypothetical protein